MHCRIFRDPEKNRIAPQEILHLGIYHPWQKGNNPNFDDFSRLILDVKNQRERGINYFVNKLRSILSDNEEYVVCVIPNHTKGTAASGIRTIAKRLCSPPIIDGTYVLSRFFKTEQKTKGGSRDWQSEMESLNVRNEDLIKGRQVLLLDDVTTTGASLKAGKYLLGYWLGGDRAALVTQLALAKTKQR